MIVSKKKPPKIFRAEPFCCVLQIKCLLKCPCYKKPPLPRKNLVTRQQPSWLWRGIVRHSGKTIMFLSSSICLHVKITGKYSSTVKHTSFLLSRIISNIQPFYFLMLFTCARIKLTGKYCHV